MAYRVTLSWQEGTPQKQGDGFRIYRSVNGGSYSLLTTVPISQTSYNDDTDTEGDLYRYRITEYRTLYGQDGSYTIESPPSAEVTVRVPVSPSADIAYNTSTRIFPIFRPTRYATKFQIQKCPRGSSTWQAIVTVPNKIVTEGGDADIDWTKWSHWGHTEYWSSWGQYSTSEGQVFWGIPPLVADTSIFDYYPYSVTENKFYLLAVEIWSDQYIALVQIDSGIIRPPSENVADGYKYVSLKPEWQPIFFVLSPSESLSSQAGIVFRLTIQSLPNFTGQILRFRNPIFVELPDVTDFSSRYSWRVVALGTSDCPVTPGTASGLLSRYAKVRLTWTEGSSSQKGNGFRIYRSVGDGSYSEYTVVPISSTSFDDLWVDYEQTYQYKIAEFKGIYESSVATTSSVTVPNWFPEDNQPQNLQIQVIVE